MNRPVMAPTIHNSAMTTAYAEGLLTDPAMAVAIAGLRDAGIITNYQAEAAWRVVADHATSRIAADDISPISS